MSFTKSGDSTYLDIKKQNRLYEYNIDRPSAQRIYPFVYKGGRKVSLKTVNRNSSVKLKIAKH